LHSNEILKRGKKAHLWESLISGGFHRKDFSSPERDWMEVEYQFKDGKRGKSKEERAGVNVPVSLFLSSTTAPLLSTSNFLSNANPNSKDGVSLAGIGKD